MKSPLKDPNAGITKPSIRRLARRGGVKRISGLMYEEVRGVARQYLENVLKDAVLYTEYAKRHTLTAVDITHSLRRQGKTLYGYNENEKYKRSTKSKSKKSGS